MKQPTLIKITGVIDNLQRWDGEENFVMGSGTKAVGGVAAISAAAGVTSAAAGLAGAAASAAINISDTEDPVEFFTCTLGNKNIFGRFGIVSFRKGDDVIMAVEEHADYWEAYAVCRPKDRHIWMYPHCSRGIQAYWRVNSKKIILESLLGSQMIVFFFGLFFLFDDAPNWNIFFGMWIYITLGITATVLIVWGGIILYLSKSAYLASTIFNALGFNNPNNVDLEKRLKTYLDNHTISDNERRGYSFYSRWVYRY